MVRVGRKPRAEALVEQLDGSPFAKLRLEMFIRTMRQDLTVPEACGELGIGESRFHELRNQWLQESLQSLEPRPAGRPPKQPQTVDVADLQSLQTELKGLKTELATSEIRLEIAQTMPHVLKDPLRKKPPKRKTTQPKRRPPR